MQWGWDEQDWYSAQSELGLPLVACSFVHYFVLCRSAWTAGWSLTSKAGLWRCRGPLIPSGQAEGPPVHESLHRASSVHIRIYQSLGRCVRMLLRILRLFRGVLVWCGLGGFAVRAVRAT